MKFILNNTLVMLLATASCIPRSQSYFAQVGAEKNAYHPSFQLQANKILSLPAVELITWWRFDIMAKYIYGLHRKLNVQSDWALRLYAAHLAVWNNFREGDGSKTTLDDFVREFNETLDSIQQNGFNSSVSKVRVDNHKYSCDGSHRIAACALYNSPVSCFYLPKGTMACQSTALYLRRCGKYVRGGLEEKFLDDMALEYTKLKANTRILILLEPTPEQIAAVRKQLHTSHIIAYEKYVFLSENGHRNLLTDFMGNINANGSDVFVFLLDVDAENKFATTVESLRKNRQFFITADHKQTETLSCVLFNDNSIQSLNHRQSNLSKAFSKNLATFSQWLAQNNIDQGHVCITSPLGEESISFVSHDSKHTSSPRYNDQTETFDVIHPDELIFNPERYFYYQNFKFSALAL